MGRATGSPSAPTAPTSSPSSSPTASSGSPPFPTCPPSGPPFLRLPTGAAILCAFEHPAAPATLLRTYDDTRAALDQWRTDLAALRGPYVIEIFLPDPLA